MIGKVLLSAAVTTLSGLPTAFAYDASSVCRVAAQTAEQQAGIPARLLDAISRVESGRRDPNGSATVAWPWTVNAAGKGYFYESKDEAIAAVRDFQARGIVSIDVGCMQINLHHHPDAFFSLDDAFDPFSNARYGARFLSGLHSQLQGWPAATAAYHSLTPALGAEYARHVLAIWNGQPDSYRPPDFLPQVVMTANGLQAMLPASRPPSYFAAGRQSGFSAPSPPRTGNLPSVHMVSYAPPPRIIHHPISAAGGGMPQQMGRSLASYRAMPVRLAWRQR
ncbi:transglycosylase SLT domain-containing protein [Gluconobacter sp. LMG 31484]|uniref:Transglycosylase SLT domain-containing protein n=1 Tax=Gluconobacter vitians TaxID=2728102 RepID=A0ABR9Y7V8_9PROT|nr:transglycosylase SLT domain-containing protein [Gluconobacter vitians]MBF0860025.1 transglycosylase SLT domain-containing protein [Gluconobacter vitians]